MEKIQTLLWILFGLGAFVFRMVKKMQETSAQESRTRPPRPGGAVPGLPAASFQELLKQMQARNAPNSEVPGPLPTAPTAPQPAEPRTLAGRPMPRELGRPARSQERSAPRPLSLETRALGRPINAPAPPARRSSAAPRAVTKSLVEPVRPGSTRPVAPVNATVRQWLRQPDTLRAAFVLSEILARRPD